MNHKVYYIGWEESEVSWGSRPDGYSLHLSKSDVDNFVKDYWAKMPDETPDEYSRPCTNVREVTVDQDIFDAISKTKNGCRYFSKVYTD